MVQPRHPRELAGAIARMLDQPVFASQVAAAGQRHAQRLLDVKVTAANVAAVYDRVLRPGTSAPGVGVPHRASA
jgi:glycosyltransferase involved in cell wall biosynthesis